MKRCITLLAALMLIMGCSTRPHHRVVLIYDEDRPLKCIKVSTRNTDPVSFHNVLPHSTQEVTVTEAAWLDVRSIAYWDDDGLNGDAWFQLDGQRLQSLGHRATVVEFCNSLLLLGVMPDGSMTNLVYLKTETTKKSNKSMDCTSQ